MNNTTDSLTTHEPPAALAAELAQVTDAFNRAMISNDVAQIRACILDDWVLVTPEAGIIPASRLLHVIETGVLSHDTMTKTIGRVRVYGDIAVVTGRGQNTGVFKGERIAADEWVTDVYRRVGGRWLCVLTHLTPALGR
jgi:ketosteroid isomerase-like protein